MMVCLTSWNKRILCKLDSNKVGSFGIDESMDRRHEDIPVKGLIAIVEIKSCKGKSSSSHEGKTSNNFVLNVLTAKVPLVSKRQQKNTSPGVVVDKP